jgi:hypothetical protein
MTVFVERGTAPCTLLNSLFREMMSPDLNCPRKRLKFITGILLAHYLQRTGLYAVGIFASVLPGTDVKFIIKSLLLLLKFKDAGQAQTEDWLCF